MNIKSSISNTIAKTIDVRCLIQICEDMEYCLRSFQGNLSEEDNAIIEITVDIINDFLWNFECPVEKIIECSQNVLDFLYLIKKYAQDEEKIKILEKTIRIVREYDF